jgi:V/A-type H+-transporting ATPase subunit C
MSSNEAYLNARVSIMMRRLLTPAQIESLLIHSGKETEEITDSARLHGLLTNIPDLTAPAPPVYALEQRIVSSVLADSEILARPLRGLERDFIIHWVRRLELSNLKAILRGKLSGRSLQDIRADLLDAGPFTTLPVEQLLRTEDFSELLRLLETTQFSDIARQARLAFETGHDLFAVDATVDRHYYNGLLVRALRIEARQGPLFRELIASIINRVNLVWLLRYRFVYQLAPAQTFYLLVHSSSSLNTKRLAELVKLESFDEVLAALPMPLHAQLAGLGNTFEVTQNLELVTYKGARSVLQHAPHALARAFAYLVMREFDLRKVRVIAKSRQLQLNPDVVRYTLGITPTADYSHASGHAP